MCWYYHRNLIKTQVNDFTCGCRYNMIEGWLADHKIVSPFIIHEGPVKLIKSTSEEIVMNILLTMKHGFLNYLYCSIMLRFKG